MFKIKTALTWAPEGRRSRGRPKETWRRTAEKERTALGFSSWSEATVTAWNRAAWRKRESPVLFPPRVMADK